MLNFLLFAVNKEALTKSFNILWQGLLAMVIVVGVIIACTYVIQKPVGMRRFNKANPRE